MEFEELQAEVVGYILPGIRRIQIKDSAMHLGQQLVICSK
jgi:hypothetical protein